MSDERQGIERVEVSWPIDDTTVYGTLVKPAGPGPFAAVAMVAGSGPTDRDWNSPLIPGTNGSARLLAEALAERGFASLRYDKRASGPHAAETMPKLIGNMSMQSHLDELTGGVRTLADDPSVDAARIFALTSSEGTLHALNYQIHDPAIPLAGLVLTGAPGRPLGTVVHAQIAAQAANLPNGAEVMALYEAGMARFLAGQPIEPDPSLPDPVKMLLMSLETPVNLPFAREFLVADAAEMLAQVRVPVLVVIGKKDVQVHWQADGGRLQQAAAGRDVTFLFPEDANHVLKHEPTPLDQLTPAAAIARYGAEDSVLDREALDHILDWLEAHA